MPDIAKLGLSIDTRQVVEGSKALDSLGEAAVRVEQKTAGATAAVDKLGEASAGAKAKASEGAVAVDALGDAGARVAPKVAGATTSVDSLSAATARWTTLQIPRPVCGAAASMRPKVSKPWAMPRSALVSVRRSAMARWMTRPKLCALRLSRRARQPRPRRRWVVRPRN